MTRNCLLLFICFYLTFCSLKQNPTPKEIQDCDFDKFTKSKTEHIINEIKTPFIVKTVIGKIESTGGAWPKSINILVELYNPKNGITSIHSDDQGFFEAKNVKTGTYCFKATINGWQSVIGIIIISNKADSKQKIIFMMPLGV